jgi:uncharacterized membrane-anchored protein YjiN (DUF445 family)
MVEKLKTIKFNVELEMPELFEVTDEMTLQENQTDESRLKFRENYTKEVTEEMKNFILNKFSKETLTDDMDNADLLQDHLFEDCDKLEDYNIKININEVHDKIGSMLVSDDEVKKAMISMIKLCLQNETEGFESEIGWDNGMKFNVNFEVMDHKKLDEVNKIIGAE